MINKDDFLKSTQTNLKKFPIGGVMKDTLIHDTFCEIDVEIHHPSIFGIYRFELFNEDAEKCKKFGKLGDVIYMLVEITPASLIGTEISFLEKIEFQSDAPQYNY